MHNDVTRHEQFWSYSSHGEKTIQHGHCRIGELVAVPCRLLEAVQSNEDLRSFQNSHGLKK